MTVSLLAVSLPAQTAPLRPEWPHIQSAIAADPAMEARINAIVAGMSLAEKVGQMTQPEIKAITPAQVTQFHIGSVLNGGGSTPGQNKYASAADWLALAQSYHLASMAGGSTRIPLIWGTDAVHGHNNVVGATLFPHNIGLGAAADAGLTRELGQATARAVRATGIQWVFAPTLAVARDARWGRTYESFSENPALVARLGAAYIDGLQGRLKDDANVVATAKHFMGDGGTDLGRDQGISKASRAEMIAVHGAGYYSALAAGVQTVMASFNSWNDVAAGINYGKMHGSRVMLTEVLKDKMGFDGMVVSDWNGISQVPGCSESSCPQAINAGIDMVMVPDAWEPFIANTIAQVERGEIAMARVDDAVRRILRVKLRAGLFDKSPAQNAWAGKTEALQAPALARRAVRQSLVLLKNNGGVLPLARAKRILVVGKSADSLQNQTGGWSLSWQGTGNSNSDFPAGQTVLAGIRSLSGAEVVFSEAAANLDVRLFDAVIAVIGETPYAEGNGDIGASGSLRHSSRYPEDLALLQKVAGHGVPVVTVLMSGRVVYANDLLNLSDAFVAAWLPGTEGGGVADLLFRSAEGRVAHDFTGRLSFAWPSAICPGRGKPLFRLGYGLDYAHGKAARVGRLNTVDAPGGCAAEQELSIFSQVAKAPYQLMVGDAVIGADLNATLEFPSAAKPALRVTTVDVNTQQDGKRLTWLAPARLVAKAAQPRSLRAFADGALLFEVVPHVASQAPVSLAMTCGAGCGASVDLRRVLAGLPVDKRATVAVPLACFTAAGLDLSRVDMPFSLSADAPFAASVAHVRVVARADMDAPPLPCNTFTAP